MQGFRLVVTYFWVPTKKEEKIQKKKKNNISKKIIAIKRGCESAQKMIINWLRRFKNTKTKFDSILLIGESSIDEENSI